jgi:hypothetical protein
VRSTSPTGVFAAKKLEKETLTVGSKSLECTKMEGEETAGGKTRPVVRWWCATYPLGMVKSTAEGAVTEAVKAGDNWGNRPPFPS